jgi:hypothetical protein
MTDFDNTNRGVLFRNDRKEKTSQPDHTGKIDIEGTEYRLSAWVKESKGGKRFFSLSVSPIEPQDYGKANKPDHALAAADDFDDQEEIPF